MFFTLSIIIPLSHQRVPAYVFSRVVQGMKVGAHGLFEHVGELVYCPSLAVVDRAEDAGLGEKIYLLAAYSEDLAVDVLRLVGGQEHGEWRHVGGRHFFDFFHLGGLLGVVGGYGGD